jgi:alpha-beta hydrolase superfamily lysophospholipase
MIEYPLFIPFERDHLAAVVTVPDGDPRALVLLLQGAGGAPHSHRYRLWTRTARALASRGFAAIRMDYRGIGDSTGSYRFAMEEPPVEEAVAMAERGLRWVGVDRMGVVGNCIGARTAVALAARMEACVSVVCVLPMALGPVLPGGTRRARGGIHRTVRSIPGLRRLALRVKTLSSPRRVRFLPEVEWALRRGTLLFLHGGTPTSRAKLSRSVADLSKRELLAPPAPGVARVRFLPTDGVMGLRPFETQQAVIDDVGWWMNATLSGELLPPSWAREPSAGMPVLGG